MFLVLQGISEKSLTRPFLRMSCAHSGVLNVEPRPKQRLPLDLSATLYIWMFTDRESWEDAWVWSNA
jgi:hypothetical protein